jgi:type IV pilus assembly protein PilQ
MLAGIEFDVAVFRPMTLMCLPYRLAIRRGTAAALALLLLSFTACKHSPPSATPASASPPAATPAPAASPKSKYSQAHDAEIKVILDLAQSGLWDQALAKANALYAKDPKSPVVERIHAWVLQENQKLHEQALEDKIREIDAANSVFNPTIVDLLTENKDRGLPATKDVRDTLHRIENTPYIPETYGKTVYEKGPLFEFESAKGKMVKVLEKEVSIHLDNVPLETAIVSLSQSAGINIVADKSLPALKAMITANLDKVKLAEFLRYVGRNYDLQFQVGDELVWVVDAKDPKKLMEETRFYRLRKGFVLPAEFGSEDVNRSVQTANNVTTVTETTKYKKFVNDLAPKDPSIERAITNLFTGSKYLIDYEHNLVMGRGTPEQLEVLERIIKELDQPIQQVFIEARFVTLSKAAFMQLGALWQTGNKPSNGRVPQDFTGLVNNQSFPSALNAAGAAQPDLGIGIQYLFTNVFGVAQLNATISALEQNGESQTLSAPRLTVLNNRPATISDGQVQYYYEEYTVASTVQQYYTASSWVPSGKPTKITAGAELNVMASVSGDGRSILLALNPRVNTSVQLVPYATLTQPTGVNGTNATTFTISLPQYRTEELATRVAVNSGDTVAMGGVLERQKSTYVESVPVLGDLPLIGPLFRRRTESDVPRYLLIFVTATIVKDNGEFLIYGDNPGTGASGR